MAQGNHSLLFCLCLSNSSIKSGATTEKIHSAIFSSGSLLHLFINASSPSILAALLSLLQAWNSRPIFLVCLCCAASFTMASWLAYHVWRSFSRIFASVKHYIKHLRVDPNKIRRTIRDSRPEAPSNPALPRLYSLFPEDGSKGDTTVECVLYV